MKIANISLKNNLILAPMAGYTTPAFRKLMAQNGAGLTVTEMISVKGLIFDNQKTKLLLKTCDEEEVKCVQLFGSEPKDFYDCLSLHCMQHFDIIDINMGCPVKKIVSNGEGSSLIKNGGLASDIVKAVKCALKNRKNKKAAAVTVKTRLFEDSCANASEHKTVEFLKLLQNAGASMITLHNRTPSQMYKGSADYQLFAKIKKQVDIPLALSGDIVDINSFKKAKDTNADFFMIGRGALINPSIFNLLLGNEVKPKGQLVQSFLDCMLEDFGHEKTVKTFRKFLPYVLKGEKCPKELRLKLNFVEDFSLIKGLIKSILQY